MLEEILKKESIDESDMKVIVANLHLLTDAELVRFGFKQPEEVLPVIEVKPKKKITK